MQPISRRTFLKQMAAAGVAVTLYANRSFHLAFANAGPTAFKVALAPLTPPPTIVSPPTTFKGS